MEEIILYSISIFIMYVLKHERDTCRSNWSKSLASKLVSKKFFSKHKKWFTNNNWDDTNLWAIDPQQRYEWDNFIVKNVLVFLNDYWKFNEFFIMLIASGLAAILSGYWWLVFPYFIIGGGLHSLLDGSLLRNFKNEGNKNV